MDIGHGTEWQTCIYHHTLTWKTKHGDLESERIQAITERWVLILNFSNRKPVFGHLSSWGVGAVG